MLQNERSAQAHEQTLWNDAAERFAEGPGRVTGQAMPLLATALDVRAGETFLDLCCGHGDLAAAAQAAGAKAAGVDYASRMVAKASARFPEIAFHIGDAEALDAREGEFDAIGCNMALLYLSDLTQALSEVFRALAPNGRFAWTHWEMRDGPNFWGALRAALNEPEDASWPVAPAIRADQASAIMRTAGFRDIAVRSAPIDLMAPDIEPLDYAATFSARLSGLLMEADPEQRVAWAAAFSEGLRKRAGAGRAPSASILLVSGRRPNTDQSERSARFGIVRKLLGGPARGDAR